jgi:diacylglycerol kinase family enzyme
MAANTWVMTAGVRLHGSTRAIADAIKATPTAVISSTTISAIALDDCHACPDAESMMPATTAAHSPSASRPVATAAISSSGGRTAVLPSAPAALSVPAVPSAERIPIVLHPLGTANLSNVRALLIINPHATSMTAHNAGLVVRALGSRLELDTRQTEYRGHAGKLAAASAAEGYDLVVTFGGDGTVNEVVNGLMRAPARPALAPIPGGSGNVFARTLGLPADAEGAVQRILSAVETGKQRTIGLGLAGERYFTFSVGLGLDAEVIADMDRQRASGRRASNAAYLRTTVRRYYTRTDRRRPALSLSAPGTPTVTGLFMGVVTNSSAWTYLGSYPVRPAHGDLSSGLDLFALRRLRTLTTLAALGHMMQANHEELPTGRDIVSASALTELSFAAARPIAFHIDGEYLGETESVAFRFVPDALSVVV